MAVPVIDTVATVACDDCTLSRVIVTEDAVPVELERCRRYLYGHGSPPALRVTVLAGCATCEGSTMLTTP